MTTAREQFEEKFPVPIGVKFISEGNYVWLGGMHHGSNCEPYNSIWQAWQACQKLNNAEIAQLKAERESLLAERNNALANAKALADAIIEIEDEYDYTLDVRMSNAVLRAKELAMPTTTNLIEIGEVKEVGGTLVASSYTSDANSRASRYV